MRRLAAWAAIAAAIAASLALALRPGAGSSPETTADRIASELRCPVCQGLSVRDSDSPTARDIRADIARRVDAGETPAQIRSAYVDRYGKWILLRPAASGFETLLWALPAAATGAGGVGLAAGFRRWRRQTRTRPPTDADRELVAASLAANGRPAGKAKP